MCKSNEFQRRFKFLDCIRQGPIYTCVCCHRIRYEKSVKLFDDSLKIDIIKSSDSAGVIDDAIGDIPLHVKVKNDDGSFDEYICSDCLSKLKKGKVPSMSHCNNLDLISLEGKDELHLTELENSLVAKNILFQMFVQLPSSRWTGIKKKIVCVPIFDQDIENTISSFPRSLQEASIFKAQLKRKKGMKNSHKVQFVNKDRMVKAIKTFKEMNNRNYLDVTISPSWENSTTTENSDFSNSSSDENNSTDEI